MNKVSRTNKIKRVKIINKFVKITQSGGELGKLNNSFFKLLFLVIFLNLLSFVSFGEPYTKNGVKYDFKIDDTTTNTGTLTISKIKDDGTTKREITQEGVANAMISNGGITAITTVKIEDGITSIGDWAFSSCTSLSSITIPNSVTNIDNGAFSSCTSLSSITISSSVTEICDWVFSGCTSLSSITIPNSVTRIGEDAFDCCTSLSSITIPKSVTEIGYGAFIDCNKLRTDGDVYYLGAEREWSSIAIDEDNDALRNAKRIHCVEELTVNKVWKDVNNKSRKKPELVLYRVYEGCSKNGEYYSYIKDDAEIPIKLGEGDYVKKEEKETYTVYKKMVESTEYIQGNFQYDLDGNGNYQDVKFDTDTGKVDDDGGKDEWQCKFPIVDHIIGNKYAVGEKRMKGYTSDAYVD